MFNVVKFAVDVLDEMNQDAATGYGSRPQENLHSYIERLIANSKGKNIRNLAHFISIVRHHVELIRGEW